LADAGDAGLGPLEARIELLENQVETLNRSLTSMAVQSGLVPHYPRAAIIEADDYINSSQGFHKLEYDKSGAPYRWTGPSRSFYFWIFVDNRQDKTVDLTISGAAKPNILATMMVYANGVLVPHKILLKGARSIVRSIIPGTTSEVPSPFKITYRVDDTYLPDRLPNSDGDKRRLGVIFTSLEVRDADT